MTVDLNFFGEILLGVTLMIEKVDYRSSFCELSFGHTVPKKNENHVKPTKNPLISL